MIGLALFDTAIGRCGVAWGDAGLRGVQLPEADDARTRAELLARQSWSVTAARMAVCAPWLVLILLATQSETLIAYDTPTGTAILVAGAVLTVGAYRLMIRIGRLPEDKRVLR